MTSKPSSIKYFLMAYRVEKKKDKTIFLKQTDLVPMSKSSNEWIIRRNHVVQDFHKCVSDYRTCKRKKKIIIFIQGEEGYDRGANISILNAYFASIRSNKCLFEMHDSLGTLPRRVLNTKDLKTLEIFGYIVHLAWIWHRLVPHQFHVSVVLFACCKFNDVENHINSMQLTTLRELIKQAAIYFPKTFEDWSTHTDTVRSLCQTYFLEHLIDNNLEQNAIKTHYDWFSAQAIKYILLGFRHLSFQHISLGGHDHNSSRTQETLITDIMSECSRAQARQDLYHIVFVVNNENDTKQSFRFIYTGRNKDSRRHAKKESILIFNEELCPIGIQENFKLFMQAALKLQKQDENFISKFLNFATSCRYIKDPITIQFSTGRKLPRSNTCVNQINLWESYTSVEELIADLKMAIEWSGDHLFCA